MRNYIIFSALIIAGLVTIIIQERIGIQNALYPYLSQIASTLLVGGTLSLLYKIFVDKESQQFMARLFRVHESIAYSGLARLITDVSGSRSTAYAELIEKSKELSIVLNDGLRWVGNYSTHLRDRFSRDTTTEFFIVDENGFFILPLSQKTGLSEDKLKEKIQSSRQLIITTYNESREKGTLLIYALKNFPTHSLFCSEKQTFIVPYYVSSGREIFPLYIFEKNNQGDVASNCANDIENLRKESKLVFDSRTKSTD